MWPFRRKRKMTEAEFLRMVICLVTYDQQDINLQPPPPRKLQPPPPREPLQEVDRAVGELIKLDRIMRKDGQAAKNLHSSQGPHRSIG